jgi:hypothetical protein
MSFSPDQRVKAKIQIVTFGHTIRRGTKGTVKSTERDTGRVLVAWDNGRTVQVYDYELHPV